MTRISLTTMDIEAVRERANDEHNHILIIEEINKLNRHRDIPMIDKISILTSLWINIAKSPRNTKHLQDAFLSLYRMTLLTVLNPQWERGHFRTQTHLFEKMGCCCRLLRPLIKNSVDLYLRLQNIGQDPWLNTGFNWGLLVQGTLDIEDEGVQNYLRMEMDEIILGRIHFFVELKSYDYALNLSRYFFSYLNKERARLQKISNRNAEEEEKLQVVQRYFCAVLDWFILLLERKRNIRDIIRLVLPLTCHDAVQLILAFRTRKKRFFGHLGNELLKLFLLRSIAFPKSNPKCCIEELLSLWCMMLENQKIPIPAAVTQLVALSARSSAHFYLCSDILIKHFGNSLLPTHVELYVRGLTVDLNHLEAAKTVNDHNKVKEIEFHMAEVYQKLSSLFTDVNELVERECILSAFTLHPTQERLYIIQSLTHNIFSGGGLRREYENEHCLNCSSKSEVTCELNCSKKYKCIEKPFHPLLTKGIQNVQYSLVKDLVIVLEAIRNNVFKFDLYDWEASLFELGEYLTKYIKKTHPSETEYDVETDTEHNSDENILQSKLELVTELNSCTNQNIDDECSTLKLPNSSIPYIAANIEVRTEKKVDEFSHKIGAGTSCTSDVKKDSLDQVKNGYKESTNPTKSHEALGIEDSSLHGAINCSKKQTVPFQTKSSVPFTNPSTSFNSIPSKLNTNPTSKIKKSDVIVNNQLKYKSSDQNDSKSVAHPTLPSHLSVYKKSFTSEEIVDNNQGNNLKYPKLDRSLFNKINQTSSTVQPLEGLGSPYRLMSSDKINSNLSEKHKFPVEQLPIRKITQSRNFQHASAKSEDFPITYTPSAALLPKPSLSCKALPQQKQVINKTETFQLLKTSKALNIQNNFQSTPQDLRIKSESHANSNKNSFPPKTNVFNSSQNMQKPNVNLLSISNSSPKNTLSALKSRAESRGSVIHHTMQVKNTIHEQKVELPLTSGFPVSLHHGQLKNNNPFKFKINPQKLSPSKTFMPASLVIPLQSQSVQEETSLESSQNSNLKHSVKLVYPGYIFVRKKTSKPSESHAIDVADSNESRSAELDKNERVGNAIVSNESEQMCQIPKTTHTDFSSTDFSSTQSSNTYDTLKNENCTSFELHSLDSKLKENSQHYCDNQSAVNTQSLNDAFDSCINQSWAHNSVSPDNSDALSNSVLTDDDYPSFPIQGTMTYLKCHRMQHLASVESKRASLSGIKASATENNILQKSPPFIHEQRKLTSLQDTKAINEQRLGEMTSQNNKSQSSVMSVQEYDKISLQENRKGQLQKSNILSNRIPLGESSQITCLQEPKNIETMKENKTCKSHVDALVSEHNKSESLIIRPPVLSSGQKSFQETLTLSRTNVSMSHNRKPSTVVMSRLNVHPNSTSAERPLNATYSSLKKKIEERTKEMDKKMISHQTHCFNVSVNHKVENNSTKRLISGRENSLFNDFKDVSAIESVQTPLIRSDISPESHSWVASELVSNEPQICCSPHEVQKCERCTHGDINTEKPQNKVFSQVMPSEKPTATVNPMKQGDTLTKPSQSRMLNSNIRDLSLKKKIKSPVQCTICNKSLASKYTLHNHMLKIHCDNPKRKKHEFYPANTGISTYSSPSSQSSEKHLEKSDTYTSKTTSLSLDNQIQLDKLIDQYGTDIPFNDKMLDYFSDIADPSLTKASDVESIEETLTCSKTNITSDGQSSSLAVLSPISSDKVEHVSSKSYNEFGSTAFINSVERKGESTQNMAYDSPGDEVQSSWQVTGTAMRYLNDSSYNEEQFFTEFSTPTVNNVSTDKGNVFPNQLNVTNSYVNSNQPRVTLSAPTENFFQKNATGGLDNFQMNKVYTPFTESPNWQHIEPKYFQFVCTFCEKPFATEELVQAHITNVHATPIHIPEPSFFQYDNVFTNDLNESISGNQQSMSGLVEETKYVDVPKVELNENSSKSVVSNSSSDSYYSTFAENLTNSSSSSYVWAKSSVEGSNVSESNTNFISYDKNEGYACDICSMTFSSDQLKQRHMEKAHILQNIGMQPNSYQSFSDIPVTPTSNAEFIDLNEFSKCNKLKPRKDLVASSTVTSLSSPNSTTYSLSSSSVSAYNNMPRMTSVSIKKKSSNVPVYHAHIKSPILASVLTSTDITSPLQIKQTLRDANDELQTPSKNVNHINTNPLEQEKLRRKNIKCDICPKILCSEASKRRHLKNVHKVGSSEESHEERLEKELREKAVMNNVKAILEKSQKEQQAIENKLPKVNSKQLLENDKLSENKTLFLSQNIGEKSTLTTETASNSCGVISPSAIKQNSSPILDVNATPKALNITIPINLPVSENVIKTDSFNGMESSKQTVLQSNIQHKERLQSEIPNGDNSSDDVDPVVNNEKNCLVGSVINAFENKNLVSQNILQKSLSVLIEQNGLEFPSKCMSDSKLSELQSLIINKAITQQSKDIDIKDKSCISIIKTNVKKDATNNSEIATDKESALKKFAHKQNKIPVSRAVTINRYRTLRNKRLKRQLSSITQTVKSVRKQKRAIPATTEALSANKTHQPHIVTVPKDIIQRQIVLNSPSVKLVRLDSNSSCMEPSKPNEEANTKIINKKPLHVAPASKILSQMNKKTNANTKQSTKSLQTNIADSCNIIQRSLEPPISSQCETLVADLTEKHSDYSEKSSVLKKNEDNSFVRQEKSIFMDSAEIDTKNKAAVINDKENFLDNLSVEENDTEESRIETISIKQVTADINSGETKFTSDITQSVLEESTCPKIILKKVKSSSKKSKFKVKSQIKCFTPKKRKPKISKPILPSKTEVSSAKILKPNLVRQTRQCVVRLNHLSLEKLGIVTNEEKSVSSTSKEASSTPKEAKSYLPPQKRKVPPPKSTKKILAKTSNINKRSEKFKKGSGDSEEILTESLSKIERYPSVEEISECENVTEPRSKREKLSDNLVAKRKNRRRSSRLKPVIKKDESNDGHPPVCITLD